jgi:syntaxin 16
VGFTDRQLSQLAEAEDDVDIRMREIQHIARSVEQLSSMFQELSTLVIEQGTILDRVDHNMEGAAKNTIKGKENLDEANKLHKSSRPIKCMATLMGLIVAGVVTIVAKTATA